METAAMEAAIAEAAVEAAADAEIDHRAAGTWIDPSGFSVEDQAYGLAAIKDALLRRGVRLMNERSEAEAVILPRGGTLSTNKQNTLVGIPSLPMPLAPAASTPALSFYSDGHTKGAAKFAASIYDPKTGKLIVSTDPAYGLSREDDGVLLFFFSWRRNDMGVDFSKNPPRVTATK